MCFFKKFNILFGNITVDAHAVVGNNIERSLLPFTQFLPVVTSCKSVIIYQDQDIGTDNTVRILNFYISTSVPYVAL